MIDLLVTVEALKSSRVLKKLKIKITKPSAQKHTHTDCYKSLKREEKETERPTFQDRLLTMLGGAKSWPSTSIAQIVRKQRAALS